MMKPIRWPFTFLLLCFVGLALLFANFLQVMSLVVAPIAPRLFRKINRFLYSSWFNLLRWSCESVIGIEFRVTGDSFPWQENAFLMANHQAMADIPALIAIAHRSGRKGDMKWFVKEPLKWVPGIGWGLQFLDCLFVKRNWTADKENVMATFSRIRTHRSPFWVISFLEGTRSNPKKIDRSREFARKTGLPPLEHLMLPRTKGFEASLEGLGPLTEAIYDVTIGYEGQPPSLKQFFFGPTRVVHLHCRRYGEIPADKNAWVQERFREKDQLLAHFKAHGRFP